MRIFGWLVVVVFGFARLALSAEDNVPNWAYPNPPPQPAPAADAPKPPVDDTLKHVPNSDQAFTLRDTKRFTNVPDWHPDDHPPAPAVVLSGRAPDVEACAHCHLPNGMGAMVAEAPALAGLPPSYIAQQMADFASGARKSAITFGMAGVMPFLAKHVRDDEVRTTADYFGTLRARPWVRVVETANVPRSRIEESMYVPDEGGGMEPIGKRILELPEDVARTLLRDSESGNVAYVPPGSIKRGERLVTTGGNGKTVACATCHGQGLIGLGPVPPIAGRSPSYIVRQLYNFQQGARTGTWSALMAPVVSNLTADDMLAIAAYIASQAP